MIKLKKDYTDKYTVIDIILDSPITPDDLRDLIAPKVDATKGVVISGRAPIWLYAFLVHEYHYTTFVATYDPRLNGAVVVATHTRDVKVGDIV